MPPEDIGPVTSNGDQDADPYVKTDLEILGNEDEPKKPDAKPSKDASDLPDLEDDDKSDEDDEDDDKKPKSKPKSESEDDEEDDDEDEDEDEVDEDEENVEIPDKSPEYRELKKKYPDLFKDFPGLRHDFFRVKAYDQIFTSVDEAKEVAEKYDGLVALEQVVASGNAGNFLNGLNNFSKPALQRLATDFLPALEKTDKTLHNKVAGGLLSNVLRAAQTQARSAGNKNLFHAAEHLAMFLWDKSEIPDSAPATSPEIEEQRRQLENRERSFFERQQTEFITDVKSTGERQLRKEVSRGLDPDDVLPEFVKDSILDKVMEDVDSAMSKDEQHIRNMNATWERASRNGHGKDFKNKLIQLYIGRARSLVGPIRRKLVTEAIAKMSKPKGGAPGDTKNRKPVPGGRAPGAGSGRPSPKDVDWSKTSDLDYLNRNVKTRK